jgi:hypothetical protein
MIDRSAALVGHVAKNAIADGPLFMAEALGADKLSFDDLIER